MNIKKLITSAQIALAIIPGFSLFIGFFAWLSYVVSGQTKWLIVENGDRFLILSFGCVVMTLGNVAIGALKSEIK